VQTGTNTKIDIRGGDFQTVKKDTGHLIVIVLAGMDQDFLMPLAQAPAQCSRFDKLRPRTDNTCYFHSLTV
jgi:hypothetical protein